MSSKLVEIKYEDILSDMFNHVVQINKVREENGLILYNLKTYREFLIFIKRELSKLYLIDENGFLHWNKDYIDYADFLLWTELYYVRNIE